MSIRENFLTTDETANYLDVHRNTIERWRKLGLYLNYTKRGRAYFYKKSDLDEFLEENSTKVKRN